MFMGPCFYKFLFHTRELEHYQTFPVVVSYVVDGILLFE